MRGDSLHREVASFVLSCMQSLRPNRLESTHVAKRCSKRLSPPHCLSQSVEEGLGFRNLSKPVIDPFLSSVGAHPKLRSYGYRLPPVGNTEVDCLCTHLIFMGVTHAKQEDSHLIM